MCPSTEVADNVRYRRANDLVRRAPKMGVGTGLERRLDALADRVQTLEQQLEIISQRQDKIERSLAQLARPKQIVWDDETRCAIERYQDLTSAYLVSLTALLQQLARNGTLDVNLFLGRLSDVSGSLERFSLMLHRIQLQRSSWRTRWV
jgi:hypothetical protein